MTTLDSTLPRTDADAVRESVSRAYTTALERSTRGEGGCCGPAPAGVAASCAGYGDALEDVPESAARSSFGCGNPVALADLEPGETVLDLGSGAGLDLVLAARKVGETGRVIGVDMTDAMLDAARRNLADAGIGWGEVRRGLIEDLPVDDASVDRVISNCVINLSPEKPAVFREIARVLRPGGRFSISDIVAEDLPRAVLEHAAAYAACVAGAISESDYLAGLRDVGLVDVEITERQVYTADQLRALVASDLQDLDVEAPDLLDAVESAAGRVASVRVVGRRP